MATYYIGADVHVNNTELAIEARGKIVARYSVPTTIPAISNVLQSLQGKKYIAIEEGRTVQKLTFHKLIENICACQTTVGPPQNSLNSNNCSLKIE